MLFFRKKKSKVVCVSKDDQCGVNYSDLYRILVLRLTENKIHSESETGNLPIFDLKCVSVNAVIALEIAKVALCWNCIYSALSCRSPTSW